jgi:excinuclease ABC subunit A
VEQASRRIADVKGDKRFCGSNLRGVCYILDEPTIGLHPRDNQRLIGALHRLRDLGNTVVLVEHDKEVLEAADNLYDFGPGSGRFGGQVVGQGTPKEFESGKMEGSLTADYLSSKKVIPIPKTRRMERRGEETPKRSPAPDATPAKKPRKKKG